jgi:hypothetical protein
MQSIGSIGKTAAALKSYLIQSEVARARAHEDRLDQRLEAAFIIGHGGKRPKQGFPAFQDACLVALKDFGLLPNSSKALRDANRKRGKNPSKKR